MQSVLSSITDNLSSIQSLAGSNPEVVGFLMLSLAAIILTVWTSLLSKKMKRLTYHGSARNLDEAMEKLLASIEEHAKFEKDMEKYLLGVEERLRKAVQGVATIRFKAFKGSGEGSNQSFSSAFLNENGNGLVISTLYSRDRVSMFGKPIKSFGSEYPLSGEESEAVTEAKAELGIKRNT